MLYLNKEINKSSKKMDWGVLESFNLGESGRGRREIVLPTSIKEETLKRGLHSNLTIGLTKSGRPRINYGSDKELYMYLSSGYGYTRRGCGIISVPAERKEEVEVLAIGNGADGDAGRIGYWDVVLIKVPTDSDFTVRVRKSGGNPSTYYLVRDGMVYAGEGEDFLNTCDGLDIQCPIPLTLNEDGNYITERDYWIPTDLLFKERRK